jgi:hypothetical protein
MSCCHYEPYLTDEDDDVIGDIHKKHTICMFAKHPALS